MQTERLDLSQFANQTLLLRRRGYAPNRGETLGRRAKGGPFEILT
ncbi:MAG: hypothetical protein OXN89_07070 [Bryobacterales bacterium]|nr:hypothetical protein [Bryobacterales bacterium]